MMDHVHLSHLLVWPHFTFEIPWEFGSMQLFLVHVSFKHAMSCVQNQEYGINALKKENHTQILWVGKYKINMQYDILKKN